MGDTTYRSLVYKPAFIRIGRISGPAMGGDGSKYNCVPIRRDPCMNFSQIEKLPVIEIDLYAEKAWFMTC